MGATRIDIPPLPREAQYRPSLFILEEGKSAFHERLHYWQHLGSTFGAFQILGFHITAKAMRITIRHLIDAGIMEVPITKFTLDRLQKGTERNEVQEVRNYLSLLNRFEPTGLQKPIRLISFGADVRFHVGWHARQPLFNASESLAIPFTAMHVKEIHALAIAKLCGKQSPVGGVETVLWNRAEKILGEETAKWTALLCDWALMSPNPNLIVKQPGEIHPGSRFLKGLEVLCSADSEIRKKLQGLYGLSSFLSKVLGWHSIDTAKKHYESFIRLAREASKNEEDAARNRQTFSAIAGMFEAARKLRREYPEALAFPHLYESILKRVLPVIAIKRGQKIGLSSRAKFFESGGLNWYFVYLTNASLVLQAFGCKEKKRDRIECVFRHLGIEESCTSLKRSGNEEVCYTYPCFHEGPKIECGYLRLCRELGLN